MAVINHSMGNRGLLRAIKRVTRRASQAALKRFEQLFLVAPDLDSGLFRQLAHHFPQVARRTSL